MTDSLTLAELQAWLRRCPPAVSPLSLSRLPQPELTLAAVLHDLWPELFGCAPAPGLVRQLNQMCLPATDPGRSLFAGLLLSLWLLQAPALRPVMTAETVEKILAQELLPLLQVMPIDQLFDDLERQEELLRFWLRALGVQPQDESPLESEERWDLVSSQRQQALFAQLRQRRRREQAVREAQQRREQQW